ncbi:MAG: asparagine synthase (glutamine-hydrolyzing) [Lachnospiraceae bacterium]|nr:asparagine synthase (glutamine-hydrolyzing) [Lachnospiraceae bacterium]
MCGIAGICNYGNRPIENIQAMNSMLLRRGPDAGNYWLSEKDRVVLGHRRLSIVDLSEAGAQPMLSGSERYAIVYNGEIYNVPYITEMLNDKMKSHGEQLRLRGTSDTEILLEAIECFGIKQTLKHVKGMFAFAAYDRQDKTLYLARDRMGEKPLYYGKVGDSFVFASDIAAIKALDGFHNEINTDVLNLYFMYGYIPQPYSIYKEIWQLQPGGILEIKAPFTDWSKDSYWNIYEAAKNGQKNMFEGTEQEAADRLESLLRESIRGQMRADVPLGAFLSGGIDSTLVVSLMQSMSDKKIRTFTVGFNEEGYNEAKYAGETARHLGTEHTELYVEFKDVMEVLPYISEAYSEPFADSSQIPTMLVSKLTKEHVTVSLSGDAGDELFCGYNTYKDMAQGLRIVEGKADFLPRKLRKGIGKICGAVSNAHTPLLYKVSNCFEVDSPESFYRAIEKTDCRIPYISKNRTMLSCNNSLYTDGFLEDGRHNLMLMDMLQYLPDDILVKVDRAGMFYSLENRIPLLDRDVIEFAWTLPIEYKFQAGITKKPMRNILYKYVPKEMMERPKKGFSIPIDEWLSAGKMHEWAQSIMSDSREVAGEILNLKYVDSLWKDFMTNHKWNPVIWYILVLEQWLLR